MIDPATCRRDRRVLAAALVMAAVGSAAVGWILLRAAVLAQQTITSLMDGVNIIVQNCYP